MHDIQRPRRLRLNPALRRMVREVRLSPEQLIYPMFVTEGSPKDIRSMPGIRQHDLDGLVREAQLAYQEGVPAVILFGIPQHKDAQGSSAWQDDGIVPRAVRALKETVPRLLVATDVCLCEYTDHGHCGPLKGDTVDNDATVPLLVKEALAHARAGADMVAPSDMMDGRVGAIRSALDQAGFVDLPIMAYSAKYASGYYGPFRDAAESAPQFGDRRGYQMDPANAREALKEVFLDVDEGADIVMVKPALAYLDIIQRVKEATDRPVACYNVSGEYAMVKAAAQQGWIEEERVVLETLTGMVRAGADLILTYHARHVARWLA